DLQLLLGTHRGDSHAAALLWERFGPRLLATARALVGDHDRAEDAVQQALVGVLGSTRNDLAAVDDVAAYLAACVRNAAVNEIRARDRRRARDAAAGLLRPHTAPDAEPTLRAAAAGMETIDHAVRALPAEQREVVALRHAAGLTFDQVGWCLGISRNTAASRYRLAVASIRRALGAPPNATEVAHAR
ncbi:MAG: RNA polymerase sigma factor, partial [Phycisphaerae bacterium]|nr:RNA polymerase sigma factor [Phycisphaerae bacterium]